MSEQCIRGLSPVDTANLASGVRDALTSVRSDWALDIFLCGAGPDKRDSMRAEIHRCLQRSPSSHHYRFHFPEHVFAEDLADPLAPDLLSMENVLAEGVDVVILVAESPGSIAELGAFANHDVLRQKLLVVIEEKHQNDKSFIMRGPVRLLRGMKGGERVFLADPSDVSAAADALSTRLWRFRRKAGNTLDVFGLLQIENFVLACLYLAEPLNEAELVSLVRAARRETQETDATGA